MVWREHGGLAFAQMGAGLDQMNPDRRAEGGAYARRAQGVGHQRAAARTEFDHLARRGVAHGMPDLDAPQADHLAEHLAHFRRGEEIARGAEGSATLIKNKD